MQFLATRFEAGLKKLFDALSQTMLTLRIVGVLYRFVIENPELVKRRVTQHTPTQITRKRERKAALCSRPSRARPAATTTKRGSLASAAAVSFLFSSRLTTAQRDKALVNAFVTNSGAPKI